MLLPFVWEEIGEDKWLYSNKKRKKEFVYLDIGGDPEDEVGRWLLAPEAIAIIVSPAEEEVSNEICLWGLIGRGTKWTCQIEAHLEIKSNEQDVSKLPDPTNLQVYSKLSALTCFCRQPCDLSLGNRGGRKQSLPENQHDISLSFHHLLEQRLVCRVLAGYLRGNMNPFPGLHLQQTWETAAWTAYWIRVRLFALSLLSSISGYSTPS